MRPALSLVAPVGMSQEDQTVWLVAAATALDDVPLELLRQGVRSAMREADHPAKVVKAIRSAVAPDLAFRARHLQGVEIHGAQAPAQLTDESRYTLDEVRKLPKSVRGLGVAGGWIDPDHLAIVEAEEARA